MLPLIDLAVMEPVNTSTVSSLSITLRELAWAIHYRVPDRAGVGSISSSELALLKQIADSPGLTVSELSRLLGMRQPNASVAITSLVSRGFVIRKTEPEDRRLVRIHITDIGAKEHRALAKGWAHSLTEAVDQLPESDKEALQAAGPSLELLLKLIRQQSNS